MVVAAADRITGVPALKAKRLTRGGNNVTILLETASGPIVAKHYPTTPGDDRDRFHAETAALQFMHDHGIDCVPSPVGNDPESRVAIMDGRGQPASVDACDADINACVGFIGHLHDARTLTGAGDIALAAEACPAPYDVIDQVTARRERLSVAADSDENLRAFLADAFDPAMDWHRMAALETLGNAGIAPDQALARMQLTLSASDFGLHNAVRRDDGSLVFVDFEYFGWDDPVRVVSDFILHPGQRLTDAQKQRFASASTALYIVGDAHFSTRLGAIFPLVALRWCMILLNPFLPERVARRRAAGDTGALDEVLAGQLEKAHRLLADLEHNKRLLTD
mgnify:CR=1 FL=1